MSAEAIKKIEEIGKAFAEFRASNDERLAEITAKGVATADVVQNVEKANAAITELQSKLDEIQVAQARVAAAQASREPEAVAKHVAQFLAQTQGRTVQPEQVSAAEIKTYRAYTSAFQAYLRRGEKALTPEINAALSVGSDPAGGYFVPPDSAGRIASLVYESSPMRQVAFIDSTGRDAKEGYNDLNEAGGGWVGEKESRPETSTPDTGKWRIEVRELYANPKSTQQALDDAEMDMGAWLEQKAAERLARLESTAFVSGTGNKRPRGFLTYTAGTPSAATWSVIQRVNTGAAGAFAAAPNGGDVFLSVLGQVKSAYLGEGCAWVMGRAVEAEARKLKNSDGQYLLIQDFSNGAKRSILGYPIVNFEDMPALAAASLSIAFANWKVAYTVLDRQGIRVLRDNLTDKPNVLFYTTKRVGGDVTNFEAIKLIQFSV